MKTRTTTKARMKTKTAQRVSRSTQPAATHVNRRAGAEEYPVADIGGLRNQLGLTQEELARTIGYSTRSVAAWQSGGQPLSPSARLKLTEAGRLGAALGKIMPPQQVGSWLRTPNAAFEGQTPMQIMERGESDRLWRMIHQIDANVAN